MKTSVKLQIAGTDRAGRVANITTHMSERGANIMSMEVEVVGLLNKIRKYGLHMERE